MWQSEKPTRMIKKLSDIAAAVASVGTQRLVVACAEDPSTIDAVSLAVDKGVVKATLLGNRETIENICARLGIDPSKFTVVSSCEQACLERGVRMVHDGEADILMKGLVPTDKYVRAILNREYGLLPPGGLLSHITVFDAPFYHKLLIVSDVAVILEPDFAQKRAMIGYMARAAGFLGIDEPRIACIAPSEQVLPKLTSSTEAAVLSKMAQRGQLGSVVVDGPLSLDLALFPEVAATKKLKGDCVAGDADGLLFPNIESANVFYKMMSHLGGGEAAPMLVGTTKPCVLTSRADDTRTKFNSICLAALSV